MRILRSVRVWTCLGLVFGSISLLSGCDGGGGGSGGANFVPNDAKIEKVNGMSPSEAFHKNDRKR